MGSSFVLFDVYRNNPRAVSVWEKRLDTKMSLPVGKCYLPMGKRASVTTTHPALKTCTFTIRYKHREQSLCL